MKKQDHDCRRPAMQRKHCVRLGALAVVTVLAITFVSATLDAAQPLLEKIQPAGMVRGSEIEVVLRGQRLADAASLIFYGPGITVQDFKAKDAKTVTLRIVASPDCAVGLHAFRIRTETGLSNLRLFSVGALPETAEVEPNQDAEHAQEIPLDTTVTGVITKEDVDTFAVVLKKGERITIEMEGLRLGTTLFDPYVAVFDSRHRIVVESDDSALLQQDPLCSFVTPSDGRYFIEVRDSAFEGSDRANYRLHVGRFQRPLGVIPAGGRPGETLDVTWIGDGTGSQVETVTLPLLDALPKLAWQKASLFFTGPAGSAPSPNRVRVADLENVVEVEPNNRVVEATSCGVPAALQGVVGKAGDIDRFRFTAKKGARFDFNVFARRILRSPLDSVLTIHDASGKRLAINDDSGGPDSVLRFTVPADGDYVVAMRDQLRRGGPDYLYRIEVTLARPRMIATLPERERTVSTTLIVPRGNRMALMVGVLRIDAGSEAQFGVEGLPEGMVAEPSLIAAGRNQAPIVFTAAADAPLGATLAGIAVRSTDPKKPVEGYLQQRTMLVKGRNDRDMWGHDADRMASVVTRDASFRIDVIAPKVPLVRNGTMQLRVRATRAEGFTAPIAVRMLYNPPGISSRGVVTIPEGKDVVEIPLTANGSAELRTWPIVVTASAPGKGGGRIEVASQKIELEVADHYFKLAFGKVAAAQGETARLLVTITPQRPFEGAAKVQVLGLPAGATCEALEFQKDTSEIVLPIVIAKDARVGRHRTILCRVIVTEQGEPVTHTLGTGELRIDPPRPAKQVAVAKPKPKAKPPAAAKPLSRLEQLRQQRAVERQSAAQGKEKS